MAGEATRGKCGFGSIGSWVTVLGGRHAKDESLLAVQLGGRPPLSGFTSINCGGNRTFSSVEGIVWTLDEKIKVPRSDGLPANISSNTASVAKELQTLRYFPAGISPVKSCYLVSVGEPRGTYLLRLGFLYGNYDGRDSPPSFSVSLDGDHWALLQLQSGNDPVYIETMSIFSAATISVCLIRLADSDAPLVNSIELRQLPDFAYVLPTAGAAGFFGEYHHLVMRINFGGPTIRSPDDPFDRIWRNYRDSFPELGALTVLNTTTAVIVDNDATCQTRPPVKVMQTALTNDTISFTFNPIPQVLLAGSAFQGLASVNMDPVFYFAEYSKVGPAETQRKFRLECPGVFDPFPVDTSTSVASAFTALQYSVAKMNQMYPTTSPSLTNTTCRLTNDTLLSPVISATEVFAVQQKTGSVTYAVDAQALAGVREAFEFEWLWLGDPCLPVPWDAIQCNETSRDTYRVSAMDLSGRNLTGAISSSISSMKALTSLNFSNNNLNGSVPDWLANLPSLVSLDISNNELTGTIPELLSIKLGSNLRSSGNDGLVNNCSFDCSQPKIGVPSTKAGKRGINKGVLIVGTLLAVALIGLISLIVVGYKAFMSNSSTNGFFDKDYRELQKRLRSQGATAQPLSLAKVRKATSNFRKKIGEGGFGPVYYGTLEDGQEVAVKVLSTKSSQGGEEFFNEIELLSLVHHRHLVSLLGYCQASKNQILVYEYMKGGDVYDRLHGKAAASNPLTWKERKSIIMEVAEGLEYLHQGCSLCIIHRDIKSKNILLTDTTRAKVADFGLSRLKSMDEQDATHITTSVKGTTGYMDPEYYITNKLTEKSDVYGFGVLVMEIICGRAPVVRSLPTEQMHIADAVRAAWKDETIQGLADPNLKGDYEQRILYNIINLALWCVEQMSKRRPSMTEVVHELRQTGLETSLSLNWNLRDMNFCSCGQSNCEHKDQHYGSTSCSESSLSETSIQLRISSSPGDYAAIQAACNLPSPGHVEGGTSVATTTRTAGNRTYQGWITRTFAKCFH